MRNIASQHPGLIPLGYMLKFVESEPSWIANPVVREICSVSPCISEDFYGHIESWPYNGWSFFDDPSALVKIAIELGVDPAGTRLFYYEAFAREWNKEDRKWQEFWPQAASSPSLDYPRLGELGFDVASFHLEANVDHSPLSCNGMADELPANAHCLLNSLSTAIDLLESDAFSECGDGPHRIIAVHECPLPKTLNN